MFEKWAVAAANYIKQANPEETEPHDVLVFGFTILFNILFSLTILLLIGWALGSAWLILQIALSFMIVRIFTGGAHLDHSLGCAIVSISYILLAMLLPTSPLFMYIYFGFSLLLILYYAPYYEPHQLKHSPEWERKKKTVATLWVIISLIIYQLLLQPGVLLGALLQALSLTPGGITITHKLNRLFLKGGEIHEKNG